MDLAKFEKPLMIGETVAVEFKRAGGTIETGTFETVCSLFSASFSR
jgi:ATP-dependent DNA helicase RecG